MLALAMAGTAQAQEFKAGPGEKQACVDAMMACSRKGFKDPYTCGTSALGECNAGRLSPEALRNGQAAAQAKEAAKGNEDAQNLIEKSGNMVEQGLAGGGFQFGDKQIGRVSRASLSRRGELVLYDQRGRRAIELNIKNIKGAVGNLIVCDDMSGLCVHTNISQWGGVRLIPNNSMSTSEFMGYFAVVWKHLREGG